MKPIVLILIVGLIFTSCASPRPWTKQEKTAAVFNVCGIMADAYTTEQMLDNGHRELNPTLSERPSDSQLAIYFPLTAFITLGVAHYWPKLRKHILFGYGGISFGAAIHNSQLD